MVGKNDQSAADLRGLIVAGASVPAGLTDATSYDLNTVTDVLAVGSVVEAAASGYVRADLASVTLTEDDSANNAQIRWTDYVWTTVAAGETWRAFVLYLEGGGTDGTRLVYGIDVFSSPLPTNGSNITYAGSGLNIVRS